MRKCKAGFYIFVKKVGKCKKYLTKLRKGYAIKNVALLVENAIKNVALFFSGGGKS